MGSVIKLDRMHLRIEQELKERFEKICKQKSLNKSALIRNWIEEFVEEHEKPLVSMDILDIVWKLNKGEERSIGATCVKVADRLGYDEEPWQLIDDVTSLLVERAKNAGSFKEVGDVKSGSALIGNENVEFSIGVHDGTWRRKDASY